MATINLTLDTFEQTVMGDGITFVDFWAEWCGPCKMFGPIFEKASDANPDIRFAKVDTEKVDTEAEQQLGGSLGIQSIPTIMAFRDGVLLFSQPGALPAASFDQLIDAIRNVDMEDVRKQIAEDEAANNQQ
jgi:Thioredoxin domain-containing protein